jgi:hypothetical protein
MNVFGNWTSHDVDEYNARVVASKQSRAGVGDEAEAARLEVAPHARPPLESSLHDYILDWCHSKGWLAVHSRMDKKSTQAKGVSDFIIVCPNTVAFIECKKRGNKPTKEQLSFLAHVKKMGWPNAVVYSKEEFHQFIDPLI